MVRRRMVGARKWQVFILVVAMIPMTTWADESREDEEVADDPLIGVEWNDHLTFRSADGDFSMRVRGRIQPRYDLETEGVGDAHSSVYLRRARLEFRGHALDQDLTYRIMPEWGRTATLRDAWVNYEVGGGLQMRGGQFQVPFSWERDSSSNFHQFVERSNANNQFQWPSGRDIGLMAHGSPVERLRYAVGGFSGQGRNARISNSTGHLLAARVTVTPIGEHSREEALVQSVDDLTLSFGAGAYYAYDNSARDWNGAWMDTDVEEADVLSVTADVQLRTGRLSMVGSLFGWSVDTLRGDGAAEIGELPHSYRGFGYTTQLGLLFVPDLLFGAVRYSTQSPNVDVDIGRRNEALVGFHIFQVGHDAKLQTEAGFAEEHDGDKMQSSKLVRIQYQLLL